VREHVVRLPLRGVCACAAGCDGAVEVSATVATGGLTAVVVHVCFGGCDIWRDTFAEGALESETAA